MSRTPRVAPLLLAFIAGAFVARLPAVFATKPPPPLDWAAGAGAVRIGDGGPEHPQPGQLTPSRVVVDEKSTTLSATPPPAGANVWKLTLAGGRVKMWCVEHRPPGDGQGKAGCDRRNQGKHTVHDATEVRRK
jgi:hypothetical protein